MVPGGDCCVKRGSASIEFLDTVFDMCYNQEKVLGAVVHERKNPDDPGE